MLRIYFTAEDLRRVRVAARPHPTWELVLSINSLQSPGLPARYWEWRDATLAVARRRPEHLRWLRAAATLVPASGNFPDLLHPATASAALEDHLEAILSLPRDAVRDDLRRTFRRHAAPPAWATSVYWHGRTDDLVATLREYHDIAVGPVWQRVHQQVETDRVRLAGHLLDSGVDGLLGGLHPSICWHPPVLEAGYPVDFTVELAGRGLTIVPAHFCWDQPVTLIHTENQPTLICPAGDDSPIAPGEPDGHVEQLANLVGRTRARLLVRLAVVPATTTNLATLLAVTPAAVSQHTRVLREAGLVTTSRFGPSVRHALTPLGHDLLRAGA